MLLQSVFKSEFIKVGMEAEDKDEAFGELVDFFCKITKNSAKEEILGAIKKREAKMSTGIHKGIAVPHGKTNAVDDIRGVLGISGKGIVYDALDGEPVNLLFMLITPLEDSEKYLRILKHLAELMENSQFYSDLKSQKDAEGAYRVLCKYEEMLASKG